jgi:hypothetical protein
MSWVKIDDQFTDHPKIAEAGPLAGWLYVCGLTYCARFLTDGFIPTNAVRRLADVDCPQDLAAKLVAVGLWEDAQGGYQVHDYLEYQPSRERVQSTKEARAEAGARGGQRSGESKRVANAKQIATPVATAGLSTSSKQNDTPYPYPYPSPINIDEIDRVGDTNPAPAHEADVAGADAPLPPQQISTPGKNGHTERKPTPLRSVPKTPPANRREAIKVQILSPPVLDWAAEHTPFIAVGLEAEKFLDWLDANGKTQKDYVAAFRNWLRKAKEFSTQAVKTGGSNGAKTKRATDPPGSDFWDTYELASGV